MMSELLIPDLKHPVTVSEDSYGVPHIYAQNEDDLFLAQGYMTARDRLAQMELMRRKGKGCLAEILGPKQIDSDWFELTLGLLLTAKAQIRHYQQNNLPMLQILTQYSKGVNAWIAEAKETDNLPAFFKQLGYQPENWQAIDTLIIQGLITQTLAFGMSQLERENLTRYLGQERIDHILPEWPLKKQHPYSAGPYVKAASCDTNALRKNLLDLGAGRGVGGWMLTPADDTPVDSQAKEAASPSFTSPTIPDGISEQVDSWLDFATNNLGNSNNWTVGGKITDTGYPYLAGDPHLGLTIPSVWYEVHLHCASLEVYGVNFPGVPGVMIGHNRKVAWSPTNGQNIQALYYREQTDPDHPGQYYHQGRWLPFSYYQVTIPVRGETAKELSIPWTIHGPVISRFLPQFPPQAPGETISVAYTGNLHSDLLQAMIDLNRCQTATEFRRALSYWGSPVQNFAYATQDGDFGIISAGYYPLLRSGDAWRILPGTGEADWIGFIPYEHVPSISNPQHQYAASANERQVTPDYPYPLGSSDNQFCAGWRGHTIKAFLSDTNNHPLDHKAMAKLQASTTDSLAEAIVPVLLQTISGLPNVPKQLRTAKEILEAWDFNMLQSSSAAVIWETFLACYFKQVFAPWWRLSGLSQLAHYNLDQLRFSSAGWKGAFLAALEVMTTEPTNSSSYQAAAYPPGQSLSWFDNPIFGERRERSQLMIKALTNALAILTEKFGPDQASWQWGQLHHREIPSLLEQKTLARGPWPADGNARTPNAAGGKEPSSHGPSWRMIVSLTEPVKAWGVYPGGQAENPASLHYDDQLGLWLECKYKELLFEPKPELMPEEMVKRVYKLQPK